MLVKSQFESRQKLDLVLFPLGKCTLLDFFFTHPDINGYLLLLRKVRENLSSCAQHVWYIMFITTRKGDNTSTSWGGLELQRIYSLLSDLDFLEMGISQALPKGISLEICTKFKFLASPYHGTISALALETLLFLACIAQFQNEYKYL